MGDIISFVAVMDGVGPVHHVPELTVKALEVEWKEACRPTWKSQQDFFASFKPALSRCLPFLQLNGCSHRLSAAAARVRVHGRCSRLAQSSCARPATLQHLRRHLLSRCSAPSALQGSTQDL